MRKNFLYVIVALFLLCGCGATQVNVTDSAGGPVPHPYYISRSLSKTPINAIYYYVGYNEIVDIDETIHAKPTYLSRRTKVINRIDFKDLYLILRVYNPTESSYKVFSFIHATSDEYNKKSPVMSESTNAASKLAYREYMFHLPLDSDLKRVSYDVYITSEDSKEIYMTTGTFTYRLLH